MKCVYLLLTALLFAQDAYKLKLDVPVVSVGVTVFDSKDNLVNNLTRDDFLVYENGVPQTVQFFTPVSAPYYIFLLFDSSGSTRNNRDFMQTAAQRLIENLRPQDSIALGSFDDGLKLHLAWTTDRAKATAALQDLVKPRESNETRFYSALDHTLRREFRGIAGRRAVVVLTDGQDTPFLYGSNGDLKDAIRSTREQRIPIYLVALQSVPVSQVVFPNTLLYLDAVRVNMQHLVDNSGGDIVFSKDLDDVVRLYEAIGQRLGTSYSLGYVPSNPALDGSFRRIEIKTTRGGLHLTQSRDGYNAQRDANAIRR